jgi:polar amino acid transport system substrate-binding protein
MPPRFTCTAVIAWLLLFGPLAAARATPPDGGTQRPLRWGADAEGGAPYVFKDPQDPRVHIGFEVDLAQALSRVLGRPIEFRQYDYKSLLSGLLRGDFDFAMNGIEVTPDRLKKIRFSRPYYLYRLQLVGRAGEQRFRDLDGCKASGAVVGTLEETAAERLLDARGVKKRIYDGQVEPYQDLVNGRIDAVLLDLPIAIYYAQTNPRLEFLGPPVERGRYAIALRPGDEALAREIDEGLARLLAAGELRAIYEKWKIWNDDQLDLAREATQEPGAATTTDWTLCRFFPLLLEGAGMTVLITVLSMLVAIALGLLIAVTRLYGPRPLRWLAVGYIEFFRGIPVLLLVYFLYYGLPEIAKFYDLAVSLELSPLQAAVLGFGLNYAAYEAEIYRAGIESVPVGQWEAAASLGMSRRLAFRKVILPQAIRVILPPMTNDLVALFKDTSVVSVISVVELSKQFQILTKSSMMYLEIGLATAALYLVMSVPLGHLSRYLETRWARA